jgi:hypothetical protein
MARKRGPDGGRKTNVQIVEHIMDFGNPMKQLVIMTAIEKYPKMCLEHPASTFESGLINGEAWLHACREILRELDEHYGK